VDCEAALDQLPDFVLGLLSEDPAGDGVREHLRGCRRCRMSASGLEHGLFVFSVASHATPPPPDLRERVLSVLREEWADEAVSTTRLRRWWARRREH